MGRQTSLDGSAKKLTLSDKNALLASAASCEEFMDNPLVEFASVVGPEAMDMLCNIMAGEKIHIPEPKNFWGKLNRYVKYPEMVLHIERLMAENKLTTMIAISSVAREFGVSFSWLHKRYMGEHHDG